MTAPQEALSESFAQGEAERRADRDQDRRDSARLRQLFAGSNERRVISMGLYGDQDKYCVGAVKNADLVPIYFPGWRLRVYADRASVPNATVAALRARGADVRLVRSSGGAAAGMFWRFIVADDPTVDRFLVRDSDSRLNPRDAFAVVDWIRSGTPVHSVRDHPNHDRPLNGGMWGATNRSNVAGKMRRLARDFLDHDSYGADLTCVLSSVKGYSCAASSRTSFTLCEPPRPPVLISALGSRTRSTLTTRTLATSTPVSNIEPARVTRFPGSVPFPTKRPRNFQHVGQVFDEFDRPRMDDVDSFLRGNLAPLECRQRDDWIYG